MTARVRALLAKEFADLRRNPSVFIPAVLTSLVALLLPFFVAVVVPVLTGEQLSDSSDFERATETFRALLWTRTLDPEAAVQAVIFQQFLVLLIVGPIAASMSTAAYSVIGEKQARTLEPLLATPVATAELLAAKVLGSFLPALLLTLAIFVLLLTGAAMFARPGVYLALLTPQSLLIMFVAGPLAALAALQMAVCVSSRANDARGAQQIGAIIVLPITGLLVAQVTGSVTLTAGLTMAISAGLVVLNAGLLWLGVALFDRESVLTRWK